MFKFIAIAFSLVLSSMSFAVTAENQPNPYEVIEQTGQGLFTRIADSQKELQKFPDLMRTIVDEELMPHVDYKYASFKILGKHLKKTTAEERQNFVSSMRQYLVRTYANALGSYKGQAVVYEKARSTGDKRLVSVTAKIQDANAPEIEIHFQMRQNKKTGQWKAYDMIVEGISLLQSKKAELSRKIQQQGVNQVALELASIAK